MAKNRMKDLPERRDAEDIHPLNAYHRFVEQAIDDGWRPVLLNGAMEDWEKILREWHGSGCENTISIARKMFRDYEKGFLAALKMGHLAALGQPLPSGPHDLPAVAKRQLVR